MLIQGTTGLLDRQNTSIIKNKPRQNNYTNVLKDDSYISFQSSSLTQALRANALTNKLSFKGYEEIKSFDIPFYSDLKGKFYKLSNGQSAVIIPKPGPVNLQTVCLVGALNEPDNIRGISHFIEHNLFNGSKNFPPGEHGKEVHKMGAYDNANTWYQRTTYFIDSPNTEDLEKQMKLHSDMVKYPLFTRDTLEKEKGIVCQEIDRGYDNPVSVPYNLAVKNLYNIQSTSSQLVLGSKKNIKGLTRYSVKKFFNHYYKPQNMCTVVIGGVDPEKTIKLIDKHFVTTETKNPYERKELRKPLIGIEKPVTEHVSHPALNNVRLYSMMSGPKANEIKKTAATELLCQILTAHNDSRLKKAVEDITPSVFAYSSSMGTLPDDPVTIVMGGNFNPGNEEKGFEVIKETMNSLKQKPITQQELDQAKQILKNDISMSSETPNDLAEQIVDNFIINRDINLFSDKLKAIDSVAVQDVQNIINDYIDFNKASTVFAHPEKQAVENASVKPLKDFISFTGKTPKVEFGQITQKNLSNNLQLTLNDDPNAIRTSFDYIILADSLAPNKPGISNILKILLDRDTLNHTEKELNEIQFNNNTSFTVQIGPKAIEMLADCMPENTMEAMEHIRERMFEPAFKPEQFEDAKKRAKLYLENEVIKAKDRVKEYIFKNDPSGYTNRLTLEKIDDVTLQDVKDFYNHIMTEAKNNSQMSVVVTGNLSKDVNLKANLETFLEQKMPQVMKSHKLPLPSEVPDVKKPVVLIESKNRKQATVVESIKFDKDTDLKNHATMTMLNSILGSGGNSRLFMDLREKQKLAYSVKSDYDNHKNLGTLTLEIGTAMTDVKDKKEIKTFDNIRKSIEGFNKHLAEISSTKVSEEELANNKIEVISSYVLGIQKSKSKTQFIQAGISVMKDPEYVNKLLEAINNVTAEDIQEAAKKFLDGKNHVISIIAPKEALEDQKPYLSQLGEIIEY